MNSEELKRHPQVQHLYKSRVRMERSGKEFKGKCPFHSEKTGSFTISLKEGKWLYHCFGCSEAGDIFNFVQKLDNCGFKEAEDKVSKFCGVTDKEAAENSFRDSAPPENLRSYTMAEYKKYEDALEGNSFVKNWLKIERGIEMDAARKLHFGYTQKLPFTPNPDLLKILSDVLDKGWFSFPVIEENKVVGIEFRSIIRKEDGVVKFPKMKTTGLLGGHLIDPLNPVFVTEGAFDSAVLIQAGYVACSIPTASFNPTSETTELLKQAEYVVLAGDNDLPGQKAMRKLETSLQDGFIRIPWSTESKDANGTFKTNCGNNVSTFKELVDRLVREEQDKAVKGIYSVQHSLLNAEHGQLIEHPDRLRFPWKAVDEMAIIMPGTVTVVYSTDAGMGKELCIHTPVCTPNGFVEIGKISIGDLVTGKNGKPTKVSGVFRQGKKKAYKVSFTDDTEVVCGEEHLWAVRSNDMAFRNRPYRVLSVKQILELEKKGHGLKSSHAGYRHHLPLVDSVEFTEAPSLPLKPYLLGAMLGDGGMSNTIPTFTNTDQQLLDRVSANLPKGTILKQRKSPKIQYTIHGFSVKPNPVIHELKLLGLWGKRSEKKFIPDCYKFSSVEDRTELLQGLLDTDGWSAKKNCVHFCSVSKHLAEDVLFLVRSLGGWGRLLEQNRADERKTLYYMYLRLPDSVVPFGLDRKQNNHVGKRSTKTGKAIKSIEEFGEREMVCISVEASDGLYVLQDFTVTHNSSLVLQATIHQAQKCGEVVLNYQAELTPHQIDTFFTSHLLHKDRLTLETEDYRKAGRVLGQDFRYYIGRDTSLTSVDQVLDLIESGVKHFHPTVVVLDNLGFVCRGSGSDVYRNQAAAMQRLTNMAAQFNLKFIVVHQARKADQAHKGKTNHVSDLDGTKAIQNDASTIFSLHRDEIKQDKNSSESAENEYSPICQISAKKFRDKGPGKAYTNLVFAGKICRFTEPSLDKPFESKGEDGLF